MNLLDGRSRYFPVNVSGKRGQFQTVQLVKLCRSSAEAFGAARGAEGECKVAKIPKFSVLLSVWLKSVQPETPGWTAQISIQSTTSGRMDRQKLANLPTVTRNTSRCAAQKPNATNPS